MMRFSKKRSEFGKKNVTNDWIKKRAVILVSFVKLWLIIFRMCDWECLVRNHVMEKKFDFLIRWMDVISCKASNQRIEKNWTMESNRNISGGVCLKMSKKWFQIKGFNHSHNSIQTNIEISRHVDQNPNTV